MATSSSAMETLTVIGLLLAVEVAGLGPKAMAVVLLGGGLRTRPFGSSLVSVRNAVRATTSPTVATATD